MPRSNVAPKGARLPLIVLALAFAAGALMFVEVHEHPRDPDRRPSEAEVAPARPAAHPTPPRPR